MHGYLSLKSVLEDLAEIQVRDTEATSLWFSLLPSCVPKACLSQVCKYQLKLQSAAPRVRVDTCFFPRSEKPFWLSTSCVTSPVSHLMQLERVTPLDLHLSKAKERTFPGHLAVLRESQSSFTFPPPRDSRLFFMTSLLSRWMWFDSFT